MNMLNQQANQTDLHAWDKDHVWHAFTQMAEYEPLLIERGEGVYLFDTEGNRYIDGSSSMWCNVPGHRHPRLDAAVHKQLDKVAHTTNLGLSNPTTTLLAKRLVEITPEPLAKVFFSSDGSSATEAALKMAFQYWQQSLPLQGETLQQPAQQRTRFVSLGEAYHGDTLGAIGVGGVDRFTSIFSPLTFEAIRVPTPSSDLVFRAYKISKRFDQDISAVVGAFAITVEDGVVASVRIAFGGMAATPARAPACEAALIGQLWSLDTAIAGGLALTEDFTPLTDLRASQDYRTRVARNLLQRLHLDTTQEAVPVEVMAL